MYLDKTDVKNKTDSKLNNLKPLDDYIKDLENRNFKFSEVIPNLQNTLTNVSSYDDLYKKLIDESYFICNELVNKRSVKSLHTRNIPSSTENIKDKHEINNNVNRALFFQSSDNLTNKNLKKEKEKSEMLSPIIKPPDQSKSYFCSATDKKIVNNAYVNNLVTQKEMKIENT